MTRLSDKELANYENAVAVALRIQKRVKRMVYQIDDPDVLEDLVGIASDSAQIRKLVLQELKRRKREKRDRSKETDQRKREYEEGTSYK